MNNLSRIEGSLDDFIFKGPFKITLPIKKSERGTHTGLVRVKREGKVFTRKQRVGRKVVIKKGIKSSLHPDNLQDIKSLEDSGIVGLVGGIHEEETFICKFKDGSSAIHKVMNKGDIIGEIGAYETSKIVGWDIVPETIQCDYGKGEGSSQKWVPDGKEPMSTVFGGMGTPLKEKHLDQLSKIFILDMINSNFDRHSGNILIDKSDKCFAIDNECIGKLNNAELHIESLKQYVKKGRGSPMPMSRVLENSWGSDTKMYQKFKDNVDENIKVALQHKDKIMKYWNQYKDEKNIKAFLGEIPMEDAIKNIQKNIEYLEQYIKSN